MQGKNLLLGLLTFIILLGGLSVVYGDCTGCGDDGHQVCPIEKKHTHKTFMKEEHKESSSTPKDGVVFAVCIFEISADGTRVLVDHVASENLMDCLKNKRLAERKYKESDDKAGVYNMTCDKVNAKVKVLENGEWEIPEITGGHEPAYVRKKVYE